MVTLIDNQGPLISGFLSFEKGAAMRKCLHCEEYFNKKNGKLYCSEKCQFLYNVVQNKCWYWKGYKTKSGIGYMTLNGVTTRADEAACRIFSKSGSGKIVRRCNNPYCVNPNHLYKIRSRDKNK